MDKVSVIIPVYNGQEYIANSIEDVIYQTFRGEIEIILVDDGSLDKSAQILDDYSKRQYKNRQIIVIHQDNQGICYARNTGIDKASGKFIMFMDQDDYILPDCVEVLYKNIIKKEADLVIGGYDLVNEHGELLKKYTLQEGNPWSKYWIPTPWGRIYRKSVIDENNIRFMITKISEDFYFNYVFISYAKKICPISYRGYRWVLRSESESHSNMSRYSEERNILTMLNQLKKDIHRPVTMERKYVEYAIVKHVYWYLLYVARSTTKEQLSKAYRDCMNWLDRNFRGYERNPLIRIGRPKGEFLTISGIVWLSVRMKQMHLFWPFLSIYSKM